MANVRAITTGYNFNIRGAFDNWSEMLNDGERAWFDQWSTHGFFIFKPIEEREGGLGTSEFLNVTLGSGITPSLLKNLTSLSVSITVPVFEHDVEEINRMSKGKTLCKLLSFTSNLKRLSLEVESMEESEEELKIFAGSDFKIPIISLLDLLGRGKVWKYLHSFDLIFLCIIVAEL
ncbi:hypothetical protein RUND412_010557, partial [Rhizina undulata]